MVHISQGVLGTSCIYEFYMTEYHGSSFKDEELFSAYASRAAEQIARYERIYTVTEPNPDAGKMAVCAMADALYGFDLIANGEGGAVQSASIGSVGVSYGSNKAVDISPSGQAKELYRCASLYLDIYRGVG